MKQYKPRQKAYDVYIEVSYVPFPSEKARREAYDIDAKLFLRAKERELKEMSDKRKSKTKGRLETALSFSK